MCNGKNSQCAMENFPLCSEESQCALLIFVRHTEEGGLRQVWHLSFFLKTSLNVTSRELLLFCGWSIRATQTSLVIFFILNMKVQRQSQDSEGRIAKKTTKIHDYLIIIKQFWIFEILLVLWKDSLLKWVLHKNKIFSLHLCLRLGWVNQSTEL